MSDTNWAGRRLGEQTIARLLAHLDEYEPRSAGQVAGRSGETERGVYKKLVLLYAAGRVSRSPNNVPGGGREWLYRKLPDDVEGVPLYDAQPGMNCLELARCFGLYTYRRRDTMCTASPTGA